MRHSYFQINVKAKIQLEVVPPLIVILLAFILAISPNILLSKQIEQISDITREDLTEQQIEAIRSLNPATTPGELANGATAIRDVAQRDNGGIIIAGSFINSIELGDKIINSSGSRDIFIGEISVTGEWIWTENAGGTGVDDVVDINIIEDNIQLVGWGHGELIFGENNATMTSQYGQDAWQAEISNEGIWDGAWRIDPILLPQSESTLWCGFR
jgi:hypothetical protein